MIQTAVTTIPNTQIEQAFYTGPYATEKAGSYRQLLATGTSQTRASATAMASRAVMKELEELREMKQEHEALKMKYMSLRAKYQATQDEVSIYDSEDI